VGFLGTPPAMGMGVDLSHLGLYSRLDLAPKRLKSRRSHHLDLMIRLDLNFFCDLSRRLAQKL